MGAGQCLQFQAAAVAEADSPGQCIWIGWVMKCEHVLECRVTDSLMQHGRNNGKKMMAVRIIKHSFEIIHLLTDQNPIQVLVDAIINRCFRAMCMQSSSV